MIQNIHQQRHQVPVTTSTVSKPTPVQPPQKPIENADPSWEEWKNKDENVRQLFFLLPLNEFT